ncbi:hypothetical protein FOZ60_014487 [Perkinsus olseni]|uniref:Uncharacterized protein n=1 Tax=Perkinsus olseni TaxID=32597 RepID=A0A7J6N7P9_PEROL|nr:hypothetical protein FOZ60_014487 [Perkinsus olseni]
MAAVLETQRMFIEDSSACAGLDWGRVRGKRLPDASSSDVREDVCNVVHASTDEVTKLEFPTWRQRISLDEIILSQNRILVFRTRSIGNQRLRSTVGNMDFTK